MPFTIYLGVALGMGEWSDKVTNPKTGRDIPIWNFRSYDEIVHRYTSLKSLMCSSGGYNMG